MRVDFDQADKKPSGVRVTGSGGPAATPRASGVKLSGRKSELEEEPEDVEEPEELEEELEEQADPDESGKRPKLKAFLLIAAMVGGFALFVWNMTGLVNNMRLDNQGSADRIVYEMEDLSGRMDEEPELDEDEGEPSESQGTEEDAGGARDGPEDASGDAAGEEQAEDKPEDKPAAQEPVQYGSESEAIQAMKNDIALKDRELEQAAEMLDAALKREAELKKKLAEHGIE